MCVTVYTCILHSICIHSLYFSTGHNKPPAVGRTKSPSTEPSNRSITKSPVLLPKLSKKPSPRNVPRNTQVSPPAISDKPTKKLIQQSSLNAGPTVILVNDGDSQDDVYEAPDVESVRIRSATDPTVFDVIHNATYEAPVMIHPSKPQTNGHDDFTDDGSDPAYAYLSQTFETPKDNSTNCTSPDGVSKYEVPIKTVDTTVTDDGTYETPDIESIRMIQAELKSKADSDKVSSSGGGGPPPLPPAMLPPKLQQRAGKFKNKKLPAIPIVSTDLTKKGDKSQRHTTNSKEDHGYTKVKNQSSPPLKHSDGMIYEEVKPKNTTPVKKHPVEQQPSTHVITAPSAPPLPPPRKPHPSQQSSPNIIKVSSQPDISGNGGLELTEDDEGEDYMDMSGSMPPEENGNHDNTPLKPHSSLPVINQQEESEDVYEAMDISRPIPPPRRKHRHTEIRNRGGEQSSSTRNKLKASKSVDDVLASEDNHYVTMHRPTAPVIR